MQTKQFPNPINTSHTNRFLAGSSDSESEDDRRVALRSNRDKSVAALRQSCDDIRTKFKNNDWSAIVTLFDELNKNLDKVQKLVPGVPKAYVRILGDLEDHVAAALANKEQKKKMSATNSKALNTMRQRLKKHNAAFADRLAAYREDPAAFGSDAEDEDADEDASDAGSGGSGEGSGAEDDGEERVDKRLGEQSGGAVHCSVAAAGRQHWAEPLSSSGRRAAVAAMNSTPHSPNLNPNSHNSQ